MSIRHIVLVYIHLLSNIYYRDLHSIIYENRDIHSAIEFKNDYWGIYSPSIDISEGELFGAGFTAYSYTDRKRYITLTKDGITLLSKLMEHDNFRWTYEMIEERLHNE